MEINKYDEIEIIHPYGAEFAVHKAKPLFVAGEFAVHDTLHTTYWGGERYTLTHIPSCRRIVGGTRLQPLIDLCKRLGHLVSNFDRKPPEFDRSKPIDLTPPPRNKRGVERGQRLRCLIYQVSKQESAAVLEWLRSSQPDEQFISQVREIAYLWRSENEKIGKS